MLTMRGGPSGSAILVVEILSHQVGASRKPGAAVANSARSSDVPRQHRRARRVSFCKGLVLTGPSGARSITHGFAALATATFSFRRNRMRLRSLMMVAAGLLVLTPAAHAQTAPTFTKDVAPILQR